MSRGTPRARTLVLIAGVAIAALVAGLIAGSRLTSPADAAADAAAPRAKPVTVPVESRVLRSQVVTRGDAAFAGSTDVELELGELTTRPIVTGQVPEAGAQLGEGDVLLEITGRPVIALRGALPMYRSLRPGLRGPDVLQLEQTLARLGFAPGTVDDHYTAATARAVAALYDRVGYPAPEPDSAQPDATDGASDDPAGDGSVDDSAHDSAEGSATKGIEATPLPATEVVYFRTLPRRIDEVNVRRGGEATGAVVSVSGADLEVVARVDDADRELLDRGMTTTIELPDGGEMSGKVTRIRETRDGDHAVTVRPKGPTAKQVRALRDANVRVTIPVESTEGKVLAVPLAALSAGPGGASRVQVDRGGRLDLVEVRVGLTAEGYAEVEPVGGQLDAGDQVVVGQQ